MQFQPSEYSKGNPSPLVVWSATGVAATALLVGVLALPAFVITPLILKAFVPKWGYGRRVLAGIGISAAAGFSYKMAKAVGGKE